MADHPHTFQGNIEIIGIPYLKEILIFCEQEVNDTQFLYLAMFYFFSFDIRQNNRYHFLRGCLESNFSMQFDNHPEYLGAKVCHAFVQFGNLRIPRLYKI